MRHRRWGGRGRLPPIVAVLRISREGELGDEVGDQGDTAVEGGLDLGEGERGADLDAVGADVERPQLGHPVDADDERRAGPEVDLDAPVRGSGDEHGVGALSEQRQASARSAARA